MGILLPTLLEHYISAPQVKGWSPKTLTGVRSNLGKFIRYLNTRGHSLKLSDLTAQDAREYVAYLQGTIDKYEGHKFVRPRPGCTLSLVTVHKHIRTLRAFSNWLAQERFCKSPPFALLELPKLPRRKIDVLSPEEIQQVLSSVNPNTFKEARASAVVVLMIDTGIHGELVGLKQYDIDWNRSVQVFGKGAKERFVPFGTMAKQFLLPYIQDLRPKPANPTIDDVFRSVGGNRNGPIEVAIALVLSGPEY